MSGTTAIVEAALERERARVALFRTRMSVALAAGDHAEVERLAARLDQVTREIGTRVAGAAKRSTMSSRHEDNYKKALSHFAEGFVAAADQLRALDAKREMYPPAWYAGERARLIGLARAGDSAARDAFRKYADNALADARALRAAAEVGGDPTARLADLTERKMLAESAVNKDAFVAQAEAMLRAGQPRRAALLLSVATDKGAGMTEELRAAIEVALDAEDPTRAQAKEIEEAVARSAAEFEVVRFRALAASGLGVTENGGVGTGRAEDAARANVERKMAAFAAGGDYGDAAPSGGDA